MSEVTLTLDSHFDKWEAWLKKCTSSELNAMNSRILRTAGLRGLEYAQDLTPRRTGRLAGSLSFGAPDNYFKLEIGGAGGYVIFGTCVEYAAAIEEGFSQKDRAGEFVPGYWSSGTFHYTPGAKTGMRLTGATVEGAHMLHKALQYLEKDMDQIVEFELRRLYAQLN